MRDLLVTRRNALRKALAGDLSLLKQLREQTGGDVVDAALDAAQDEISSQLAEVESRELANIERALVRRFAAASTANAKICNCKIPLARLNALPYATSCIECQRAAETSGGAGGQGGDWSRVLDTGFHRRRRLVQRPGSPVSTGRRSVAGRPAALLYRQ